MKLILALSRTRQASLTAGSSESFQSNIALSPQDQVPMQRYEAATGWTPCVDGNLIRDSGHGLKDWAASVYHCRTDPGGWAFAGR